MKPYFFTLGLALIFFSCGENPPAGGQSYFIEDQTPVSVLVAPELSAENIDSGIRLTWSDVRSEVAHVDRLILERRRNTSGENFSNITTLSLDTLGYIDTGVSLRVTYQYRFRMVGEDDQILHSEPITILRERDIDTETPVGESA